MAWEQLIAVCSWIAWDTIIDNMSERVHFLIMCWVGILPALSHATRISCRTVQVRELPHLVTSNWQAEIRYCIISCALAAGNWHWRIWSWSCLHCGHALEAVRGMSAQPPRNKLWFLTPCRDFVKQHFCDAYWCSHNEPKHALWTPQSLEEFLYASSPMSLLPAKILE